MYSQTIFIVLTLAIILQGEATGTDEDNSNNNVDYEKFMRLKETLANKEAELKKEILKAIKKLEDTKTEMVSSTSENIKTFFEHPLLNEKTSCQENQKASIIKHYTQLFSLNMQSCLNLTESIADAELLLYDGTILVENITATLNDVLSALEACELKGPLLKYLCYMSEFKTIQSDLLEVSKSTSVFVHTVEKMLSTLYTEFKNCFFHTKTNFLNHRINEIKTKLNSCN